jgi:hypothetical protein
MRPNSRFTVLVLLFTTLAAAPALWALEFPSTPVAHPVACHDSMPESPSPAPVNHQCCSGGHLWAVPASTPIVIPAIVQVGTHCGTRDFQRPFPGLLSTLPISDSPPITDSLRI